MGVSNRGIMSTVSSNNLIWLNLYLVKVGIVYPKAKPHYLVICRNGRDGITKTQIPIITIGVCDRDNCYKQLPTQVGEKPYFICEISQI